MTSPNDPSKWPLQMTSPNDLSKWPLQIISPSRLSNVCLHFGTLPSKTVILTTYHCILHFSLIVTMSTMNLHCQLLNYRAPYFMSLYKPSNFQTIWQPQGCKLHNPFWKIVVLRMGWVYASCGSKEEIQQFSTEGHFTLESPVLMRCIYSAAAPIKSPVFSFRFLYAEQWDQVTMP